VLHRHQAPLYIERFEMVISSSTRAYGFSLLAFALFTTHDSVIKAIGTDYSVFQIIFFSSLFAFIPLTVMMMADRNLDNYRPRHPWLIAARTMLSLTAMSAAFFAFTVLPLSEVYALLFITPLLITAFSVPFLGEKVGLIRWIAVIVGLGGVLVVLRPGQQPLEIGHLAALVAALCSSLSNIIVRKIGSKERSAVLILIPMISGILIMAMILPSVYVPTELPTLGAMALVGLLAVGAQVSVIAAYRAAPSIAMIAPVQYTQILWATLFGALFFDEYPDIWVAVGAAIIIGSGVFVVWRETIRSGRGPVLRIANPRPDAGPSPQPKGVK